MHSEKGSGLHGKENTEAMKDKVECGINAPRLPSFVPLLDHQQLSYFRLRHNKKACVPSNYCTSDQSYSRKMGSTLDRSLTTAALVAASRVSSAHSRFKMLQFLL